MTCQLHSVLTIPDLEQLHYQLSPKVQLKSELNRDDDLDNRWNWDDEVTSNASCIPAKLLRCCPMAISPDLNILVFGNERNLAIYRKSVTDEGLTSTTLLCSKTLPGIPARDEFITSLAIMPFVSTQTTNPNGIDWYGIVVGFNTGVVRVFTENGNVLLTQKFDEGSITSIKCSSSNFKPISKNFCVQTESIEGLSLIAGDSVIIIEGFALYQTLRSARNQLARLRTDEDADFGLTVTYKKWYMQKSSSAVIKDVAITGYTSEPLFDQMVRNTIAGRFYPPKKETATLSVVTAGEDPYVGLQCSVNNDSAPSINEVAQVVVSQVKRFIPLFGQKAPSNSEVVPSSFRIRCSLYDQHRDGLIVVVSPDTRLIAATDSYGRVVLIDSCKMTAIRMWKGYRDAEVAWIDVAESSDKSSKSNLCLCIYAPKRGLLEIWRVERGPRIASFSVGKECRLFSFDHLIFGSPTQSAILSPSFVTCCLFDTSSATLTSIEVPFVCTLADENNRNVRNNHLMKEFKKLIKNKSLTKDVVHIFQKIDDRSVRVEVLEFVMKEDLEADFIASMLSELKKVVKSEEGNGTAINIYDSKLVIQMICRVENICQVYKQLSTFESNPSSSSSNELPEDIDLFAREMDWKAVDVAKCISLFNLHHTIFPQVPNAGFRTKLSLSYFSSIFNTFVTQVMKNQDGEVLNFNVPLQVKWSDHKEDSSTLKQVASFIFEPLFDASFEEEELFKVINQSCLESSCLLKLLFICWLESPLCHLWDNWKRLTSAAKKIASTLNETTEDNSLSVSWRAVCGLIANSKNQPASLIAGFVVQVLQMEKKREKRVTDESESLKANDDDWETLYVDQEMLNIMLKQLEDAFLLDLLLRTSQKFSNPVSLVSLIKSDPGIVSELVAKWAVASKLRPSVLISFCDDSKPMNFDAEDGEITSDVFEAVFLNSLDFQTIGELIVHARRRFPSSLERDVLAANCCWEAFNSWRKSPNCSRPSVLNLATEYLSLINSATLKHNLSCFIWSGQLARVAENLCWLIEKMGKTPKDRICRKELNLPEDCLEIFANLCHEILDSILVNSGLSEHEGPLLLAIDDWWKNSTVRHQTSLMQLLSHVSKSNSSLILEHLHMLTIIRFIVTFHLKGVKPFTFFSSSIRALLFKDIHTKQNLDFDGSDSHLTEVRTKLMSCFTYAIAENVSLSSASEATDLGTDRQKALLEANKWFGEVLVLSREWNLDMQSVRKRFVSDLFLNSVDDLAEEVLCTMSDKGPVAKDLLVVAGLRLLSLLSSCPAGTEDALCSTCLQWLKSIEQDVRIVKTSKEATKRLLETIRNEVSEMDSSQCKLVSDLMDGLKLIDD